MIVECELALVTSPVGVNLYLIRRMAPEGTKTSEIMLGVLPYILVVWVMFALLRVFPEIVTRLPSTMRKG